MNGTIDIEIFHLEERSVRVSTDGKTSKQHVNEANKAPGKFWGQVNDILK